MNDEPSRHSEFSQRESESAAERFACEAARLLSDNRCEEPVTLDVRRLSPVADYLVLATGTSERQIQSVAADVKELGRQEGRTMLAGRREGGGRWIVLDFVDVVVHLFDEEMRQFYDLESLWSDGKRVDWESETRPGQFADLWSPKRRAAASER
jgi:ribosome-associated protein